MDQPSDTLLCPSAHPDMAQARVIGIISGTPEVPQVAYLEPGVVVDATLSSQLGALAGCGKTLVLPCPLG